jgi:hypothetical protein
VGVAWNGSESAMNDFVAQYGISFPTVVDQEGAVFARFGVPYQPAWTFVSRDGTFDTSLGALSDTELADRLSALAGS